MAGSRFLNFRENLIFTLVTEMAVPKKVFWKNVPVTRHIVGS
jgi:hypothetical protein